MQIYVNQVMPLSGRKYFSLKTCEIYLAGCNFKCPYCNKGDMLSFEEKFLIDIREIKKEIEANSKIVEAVMFTGGEPTLQSNVLYDLLKFSKKMKLKTIVHTNGSKPEIIEKVIKEKLLDHVILDIKSPLEIELFQKITKAKTYFVKEEEMLGRIVLTMEVMRRYKIPAMIVTVIIPTLLYKIEDLYKIAELIKDTKFEWELRGFNSCEEIKDEKLNMLNEPTREFLENLSELVMNKYPQIKVSVG